MSLADAPDYLTAIAAGEAHGLAPRKALQTAFGKWMSDSAETIQKYGLANFYDGQDKPNAFVNYTALTQLLTIIVTEQGRSIQQLKEQVQLLSNPTPLSTECLTATAA